MKMAVLPFDVKVSRLAVDGICRYPELPVPSHQRGILTSDRPSPLSPLSHHRSPHSGLILASTRQRATSLLYSADYLAASLGDTPLLLSPSSPDLAESRATSWFLHLQHECPIASLSV